ncbi:hypothetical protein [Vibrio splendidus]|uniref:hypothetical protein n=1 Tax=Vibrio splendidus TaxID=29497 RepID=UPI0024699A2D|nr:hypothetical protein [Vibrio splendidus]MDH6025570.1 hypothetical protein [Vibrio splendidus]
MNDIVKKDRGTVKRITFDLMYPNGQIKTVVVENNCVEDYGTFSAIYFDEKAIDNHLLAAENRLNSNSKTIKDTWTQLDKGDNPQYPPAMLIVNTDGDVIPKCGAHKQLSPRTKIIK